MSWRAITEADVLTQISGDELAAVRAASLQAAQADPLAPTITQVTQEVRGYVAACSQNVLDATGTTVPTELIGHAVAIIVPRLMARVAGLSIDKDKVRGDAAREAMRVLRDVAACHFAIVQPTTATSDVIASPAPKFSSTERTRNFSSCKQDGI